MAQQIVYVLCGLPGSGKSTWCEMMTKKYANTVIVSGDSMRHMVRGGPYTFDIDLEPAIDDAMRGIIQSFLAKGFDVIVDEPHLTKMQRAKILLDMPRGVNVFCILFKDLGEENLNRRMANHRGYSREHWAEVLEGMRKVYVPPTLEEGFDDIIYA